MNKQLNLKSLNLLLLLATMAALTASAQPAAGGAAPPPSANPQVQPRGNPPGTMPGPGARGGRGARGPGIQPPATGRVSPHETISAVDLAFGSVTIPAGSYTLYMMPMETGASQLVFSKNVGKWGIPVDTTADVAKVDLQKSELSPANEQLLLAFAVTPSATGTPPPANPPVTLKIMWESTQYAVDFTVKP